MSSLFVLLLVLIILSMGGGAALAGRMAGVRGTFTSALTPANLGKYANAPYTFGRYPQLLQQEAQLQGQALQSAGQVASAGKAAMFIGGYGGGLQGHLTVY